MKQLMAGGGVALIGITTVSYTHLDVYKRQPLTQPQTDLAYLRSEKAKA